MSLRRDYLVRLDPELLHSERQAWLTAVKVPDDSCLGKGRIRTTMTCAAHSLEILLEKARDLFEQHRTSLEYHRQFSTVIKTATYLTVAVELVDSHLSLPRIQLGPKPADRQARFLSEDEELALTRAVELVDNRLSLPRGWQARTLSKDEELLVPGVKALVKEIESVVEWLAVPAEQSPSQRTYEQEVQLNNQRLSFAIHLASMVINVVEEAEGRPSSTSGKFLKAAHLYGDEGKLLKRWYDLRKDLRRKLAANILESATLDEQCSREACKRVH